MILQAVLQILDSPGFKQLLVPARRNTVRDDRSPVRNNAEFQEIGHCGGQFTIRVSTDSDGHRGVQFGIRHSRSGAAGWFAIYALRQGMPIGMIEIRGIGQPWNTAPAPDCIPVLIASDNQGKFGHRCPRCRGYWRSTAVPARCDLTCPYCGNQAPTHEMLTDGQRQYVAECCRLTSEALTSTDGEYVVDMDGVADSVGRDAPKPKLYSVEESQQNKFTCPACGAFNDILGRFGYCSNCGTYNSSSEIKKDIAAIQIRIANGTDHETYVKQIVGGFDSCARQIAKQLARRVPMTPRRQKEWKRRLFHSLTGSIADFRAVFDIDIAKAVAENDISFAGLMFHRRHVYEHNGGEVDEKYITDSGDSTVRVKQVIHETRESATRLASVVLRLAQNLSDGFHVIFPPEELPTHYHAQRVSRQTS